MATIALSQIRWVRRQGGSGCRHFRGGAAETGFLREDASQTWAAGSLIAIDDDGDLEVAVGNEGTPGPIAGQAMEAATGTEGSDVFFAVIDPNDIFVANVYHGTIGSAVTSRGQLREVYGIKLVSGKWHVDIEGTGEDASTANARVQVIGFWDEDALGDTYGRVLVQFLKHSLATDGNPNTRILQLAQ